MGKAHDLYAPLRAQGLTLRAIAAMHGVSHQAVADALRKPNKPGRPRKSIDPALAAAYARGLRPSQAARELGVNYGTALWWWHKWRANLWCYQCERLHPGAWYDRTAPGWICGRCGGCSLGQNPIPYP